MFVDKGGEYERLFESLFGSDQKESVPENDENQYGSNPRVSDSELEEFFTYTLNQPHFSPLTILIIHYWPPFAIAHSFFIFVQY